MAPDEEPPGAGPGLLSVRYGIPVLLIVVGLGFLLLGSDSTRLPAWAGFTGAGLSVLLLNALYRVGVSGERERDEEADAREYLEQHGEWPEEQADSDERPSGRRWRLPEGVATPESEAAEAPRAARDPSEPGHAQGDR